MDGPNRRKVFSLIPFFLEATITPKYFVMKMEVYPEAELIAMYTLGLGGVHKSYVPVKELIPITRYDYWGDSWKLWCK